MTYIYDPYEHVCFTATRDVETYEKYQDQLLHRWRLGI